MLVLVLPFLFPLDCTCRGGARGGGGLVRRGLGGGGPVRGGPVRGGKLVSLSEAVNLSEEVGGLLGLRGQDLCHQSGFWVVPLR